MQAKTSAARGTEGVHRGCAQRAQRANRLGRICWRTGSRLVACLAAQRCARSLALAASTEPSLTPTTSITVSYSYDMMHCLLLLQHHCLAHAGGASTKHPSLHRPRPPWISPSLFRRLERWGPSLLPVTAGHTERRHGAPSSNMTASCSLPLRCCASPRAASQRPKPSTKPSTAPQLNPQPAT